ncbi:MAG TPA: hypothetical protein VJJ76_02040 [archaeon]|nr:hypothetical protein [archaeon]
MKVEGVKCDNCGHDDFDIDDPHHQYTCLRCNTTYEWEFWQLVEEEPTKEEVAEAEKHTEEDEAVVKRFAEWKKSEKT